MSRDIHRITILGGRDKDGLPEDFTLTMNRGDILCVVGPTGAGKSRFLEDIGCLAQGDTPTGRRLLLDDRPPSQEQRYSLEGKLIAQLSQNMNFIMDLTVKEFILMHAESRNLAALGDRFSGPGLVDRIVAAANRLTGEALSADTAITQLSGGQSRSLMIADTALLSPSPVVLIDELENAGVDRSRALELLVNEDKIVLVSTHDPVLALLGQRRVCIHRGGVRRIIETSPAERHNAALMGELSEKFLALRELLREGASLDFDMESFFARETSLQIAENTSVKERSLL
ncbi:ATP-binding cassette domain-containing protein [Treponema primitia]|uniref:ATP-binding cassette domain-containing protein n=1 Tax=Treponema primitia TaxID=88058 RepID=UPI000255500B|nr:ATP-binding cassette domain-containing protein [Treponema primitia]